MVGRRIWATIAGALATASVAIPTSASGAVTLGQTFVPDDSFGGAGVFIQSKSPASTSYTVPTDGVITRWSYQAPATPTPPLRLKIVRPAGGNDLTSIGGSALETPTPSILNTWPTRISVRAGDLLGNYFSGTTMTIKFHSGGAFGTHERLGSDPPVGTTNTYFPNTDLQVNVAAVLEADADGDGFGDDSQDACPTDPSTQAACPTAVDTEPPEVTITKGAPKKTDKHKVKFKFRANEAGATFECKKDKKPWKACSSPTKMKRLDEGKHKFKVRATDAAGNTGKPAKDKFKVVG